MKRYIALLVCIVGLLTLAGCSKTTTTSNYGTKLTFKDSNSLYYTSNVTAEEADALGNDLVKREFFRLDSHQMVQLNKTGSTYEMRYPVDGGFDQDQEYIAGMNLLAQKISAEVFKNCKVEIHLCNERLETLRTVVY